MMADYSGCQDCGDVSLNSVSRFTFAALSEAAGLAFIA